MIKLSISNIAFKTEEEEELLNYLKQMHMDLEIAPSKLVGDNPYHKLKLAKERSEYLKEKYNISIVSMQSLWYGVTKNIYESEEIRYSLISYTKEAIDFAANIGCSNLVFGCPKNRNLKDKEKDYDIALSFFREIGKYAQEKGVVIALEPNPIIYHTNFLNTTSETLDFVKEINMPSLKINYDLGTVIYNKESLNVLKDNMTYINHIHISEPNLVKIKKRKLHKLLFKILKDLKYNRYVSIEMGIIDKEEIKEIITYIRNLNDEEPNSKFLDLSN